MKPVLMNADMVNAVRDGTKTETRRIVKYDPILGEPEDWCIRGLAELARYVHVNRRTPLGAPGEAAYVRETFHESREHGVMYRAQFHGLRAEPDVRWTPSIHMPRRLSRIVLDVVDLRVERLHDITEQGALAEGVARTDDGWFRDYLDAGSDVRTARGSFETLWRSIYGDASWDANPWVWVTRFTRRVSR